MKVGNALIHFIKLNKADTNISKKLEVNISNLDLWQKIQK